MADNYMISRDRAQEYFLSFDQEKIIANWSLAHDAAYLYVQLFGRRYNVCRSTGVITDSRGEQADFCQSLTIFDLLCHSAGGIVPTGNYAAVNSLPGAPKSGGVAPSGFARLAKRIEADTEEFCRICEEMGAKAVDLGDICYCFPVFDKLSVLLKFYHGDEEFPPTVTLLWDENTLAHMHYETVFYAAGCLAQQLEEAMAQAGTHGNCKKDPVE